MLFFVCQFRKFPIVRGLFQPLLKLLVEAAVLDIHPGVLVINFLGTDRKLVLFLFPAIHIFLDHRVTWERVDGITHLLPQVIHVDPAVM